MNIANKIPNKNLNLTFYKYVFLPIILCSLLISPFTYAFDKNFFAQNGFVYYDPTATQCINTLASQSVGGTGNIAKIWNFLVEKGLSKQQAAGVLGNIQAESGFSPFRQEDSRTWPDGGYGLVQWTGSRRSALVSKLQSTLESQNNMFTNYYKADYGKATNSTDGYVPAGVSEDVNDKFLTLQLDYLYQESSTRTVRSGYGTSGQSEWDAIKSTTTIHGASDVWLYSFERPADQSKQHADKRANYGEEIYKTMTDVSSSVAPSTGNGGVKIVGATYYGGQYSGGKWRANNKQQGGGNDDNGMGYDGVPLPGKVAYAELNMGSALGKLPKYAKLAITYNNRTVIAEKRDIGGGGGPIDNKPRAIDLWWETARMLDFKSGAGLVTVRQVADSTPLTPFSTSPIPLSDGNVGTPDNNSAISADNKGTILLDPGHGANISEYTDTKTGLVSSDTLNGQESTQMLVVANRIKSELENNGFKVVLSRNSDNQSLTDRARVDSAIGAKAILGISLHSTPGDTSSSWPQRVGAYREYNGKKISFDNSTTAGKSLELNKVIAKTRSEAEGKTVSLDLNGSAQSSAFSQEKSKGNIPLVSLYADNIPWSYNQFGLGTASQLSENQINQYVKGIVSGVIEANPASASATSGGCSSPTFSSGDLSATTLAYAWPQYKGNYTIPQQAYIDATNKAVQEGQYTGAGPSYCRQNKGKSIQYEGIDCGGFVTRLVVNSGWDPAYNNYGKGYKESNTVGQRAWAELNWEKIGSNVDVGLLKPGDVAFSPGHTFIFVGDIPGFGSKIASASLCQRAPVAGTENPTSSSVTWYRKKV